MTSENRRDRYLMTRYTTKTLGEGSVLPNFLGRPRPGEDCTTGGAPRVDLPPQRGAMGPMVPVVDQREWARGTPPSGAEYSRERLAEG